MAQQDSSILNANQYENDAVSYPRKCAQEPVILTYQNWKSHVRWTGPQIHQQLPNINVVCAGMGTSGTMTGIGQYFKNMKPSVLRLG